MVMSDILFDLIEVVAEVVVDLLADSSRRNKMNKSAYKHYDSIEDRYQRMNDDPAAFTRHQEEPDAILDTPQSAAPLVVEDEMLTEEMQPQVSEEWIDEVAEETTETVRSDRTKEFELQIMMLVYMFQQDDDKITWDEARIIKKYVKSSAAYLSMDQLNQIKQLPNKSLSYSDIQSFITMHSIASSVVSQAFVELEDVNKVTKRHDQIIGFLRNAIWFD